MTAYRPRHAVRRRHDGRAAKYLVALGVVASTIWGGLPTTTAAAADEFTAVGRLERMPADAVKVFGAKIKSGGQGAGTLLALSDLRQLWQFFPHDDGTSIAVRSIDTLKIIRTLELPRSVKRGTASEGGDWLHAVDRGRRLFLLLNPDTGTDPQIATIDLRTFAVQIDPQPTIRHGFSSVGSLTYDPYADALILVLAAPASAFVSYGNTVVYRFDLKTRTVASQTPRRLRSCTGPLQSATDPGATMAFPIIVTKAHYFFTCGRSGNLGTVVRVERAAVTDANSTEDFAVGPARTTTILADVNGGRVFMITASDGTTPGGEIWAFDIGEMTFVGIVGSNADGSLLKQIGYGIDQDTGRVFFLSPSYGLGVAEGRYFPVPQARAQRSLRDEGEERIWSDAKTGRIFVLAGAGRTKQSYYTIYRVPSAPPPIQDVNPDAYTVNRPEKAGVTDSNFNATASGYGARVLLAGGAVTMLPLPTVSNDQDTATAFERVRSRCAFTDRELIAARVERTEAGDDAVSAEAEGVRIDSRTTIDLEQPSRCDPSVRTSKSSPEVFRGIFATAPSVVGTPLQQAVDNQDSQNNPRWKELPAECNSYLGGKNEEGTGDAGRPYARSDVSCPIPGDAYTVTGHAEASLSGAVTVGRVTTSTKIEKLANGGVRSTAIAVASDVDIAGVVKIAEIRSHAQSWSNGRPSTEPMSQYSVTLSGVRIAGQAVCPQQAGSGCDTAQVVSALNLALAGRAQFRAGTGGANASLLKGSPRGALTAVQKSEQRQASDRTLVGDFTVDLPGLEMIVYNNNATWGRARQLYQFAGVATSASYVVVLVPTGIGPDILPDIELPEIGPAPGGGVVPGPAVTASPAPTEPPVVAADSDGGPIERVLGVIGRGLRLLLTNPREALLLFTAWLLLAQPVLLERRRRLLRAVRAV